jgi:hypothetical protein
MKLVRAGLCGGADLRCGAAELSRIDAGLHFKLLNGINGRLNDVGVEIHIRVLDPVESVAVEFETLAGN